jgi:uncharacterized Zn finger protein (UPF0148 family)
MRLFRRKRSEEDEVAHCPRCREPVPKGAVDCMMCGEALGPLREVQSHEDARSPHADRHVR